ncbi:MAG TPA: glycosyltransferase family 2 protein [Nitrospiria bacterium]|nr:glycosyltransferase family 2 protein [Nitrospiria bacterium]
MSVALCTYNGGRYLGEQLESLASQTLKPRELVVCDDGSTDDTVAIIRDFALRARFPVRLFLNPANLGSTKNFEHAIQRCEGDLIALSDQDDVWRPRKLERVVAAFEAAPDVGAVFSDGEVVDETLRPLGYGLWDAAGFDAARRERLGQGHALEVLLKNDVVTGAALAFRRTFRDAIVPIPAIWVHDAWIALVIAALGKVGTIDEPLILYRKHRHQQVGVVSRSDEGALAWIWSSLADVRRDVDGYVAIGDEQYTLFAERYEIGGERLAALGARVNPRAIAGCRAKAAHFRARAAMTSHRWRRVPLVLGELARLRYFRYSSGAKSLARDLVRAALFWKGTVPRASGGETP